jgi:hypothetical protein
MIAMALPRASVQLTNGWLDKGAHLDIPEYDDQGNKLGKRQKRAIKKQLIWEARTDERRYDCLASLPSLETCSSCSMVYHLVFNCCMGQSKT